MIDSGTRSAVESAPAENRSILIRGSAGSSAESLTERDAATRRAFADGVVGRPTEVSGAGFATGRQLTGVTGDAVADADGTVYAAVTFLDDLADYAELAAGAWPVAGDVPTQVALAVPAATILGVSVGDRLPITDRITGEVTDVNVVGVWRPTDLRDSYWRLVPYVAEGAAPQSATYEPLTVDRADFLTHFTANASAAWVAEPALTSVAGLGQLHDAARS